MAVPELPDHDQTRREDTINTVTIIDYGGTIGAAIAQGKAYALAGTHLAVKYCASACVTMLSLVPQANVCFYPDAWIGYHTEAMYSVAGICCIENPNTMVWQRGKDWIKRGYKPC